MNILANFILIKKFALCYTLMLKNLDQGLALKIPYVTLVMIMKKLLLIKSF